MFEVRAQQWQTRSNATNAMLRLKVESCRMGTGDGRNVDGRMGRTRFNTRSAASSRIISVYPCWEDLS